MLVLSRKVGEVLVIGSDVRLIVQRLAGGKVSLVIDAPAGVKIMREELLKRDPPRKETVPA